MDLAGGHFPQYNPDWVLDGSPSPDYRANMSRSAFSTGSGGATIAAGTGVMLVVPVVCMPGDVITAINVLLDTAAATQTHAFAALYTGITSSATLIYQSTDEGSTADSAGALSYSLGSGATTPAGGSYLVGGTGGTPQGAAYTGTAGGKPIVLGVGLMWAASTMPKFAGALGSGANVFKNQLALAYTAGSSLTTAAPATLSGIAAKAGPVPYVALTRGN